MYYSLQGNVGLGKAIEYFTSNGIPVSIQLNDTQPYDLIADINGQLCKIQVKTSRYTDTNGKSYCVNLKNSGGNRTGTIRYVTFNNADCDYLFVYLINNKIYLIPTSVITVKTQLRISEQQYSEYEVFCKDLTQFIEE